MSSPAQSSTVPSDQDTEKLLPRAAKLLNEPLAAHGEIQARMKLALALRSQKQLEAAEALYKSVLEFSPGHAKATVALVQLAATRGAHSTVVELATKARNSALEHPVIARLEGRAFFNLGDPQKAREVLANAAAKTPNDFSLQLAFAQTLKNSGCFTEALSKFAELRRNFPERTIVWLQYISLLLERCHFRQALAVCDEAPDQSVEIDLRRARALRALGDEKEACAYLNIRSGPETPPNATVLCALGNTLRSMGDLKGADKRFKEAICVNPNMIGAYLGRIQVSLAKGDLNVAKKLLIEARSRRPEDVALMCMEADLLIRQQNFTAARDLMMRIRRSEEETPQALIMLSRALLGLGDAEGAEELCEEILRYDPVHQLAALRRVDALMLRDSITKARKVLDDLLSAIRGQSADETKRPWVNPEVHIRRAELSIHLEDLETAHAVMQELTGDTDKLRPAQVLRCTRIALRLGCADLTVKNLEAFLRFSKIPYTSVIEFVVLLLGLGQENHARRLSESLIAKVWENDRETVRLALFTQIYGPIAAMQELRTGVPIGMRDLSGARQLSQTLISAGEYKLANRYLRFCVRRWPSYTGFANYYISTCLWIGLFEDALSFINSLDLQSSQRHRLYMARLLVASGDIDAAYEIAIPKEGAETDAALEGIALQISLALGDLDKAEELVRRRLARPSTTRRLEAHFQVTHLGGLLNELRLLSMGGNQRSNETQEACAVAYFQPARKILDQWMGATGPQVKHGEPIPRRIIQYWDTSPPPAPVSDVLQTWRHVEGFEHILLDFRSAQEVLREKLGAEYNRAFRLANTKAEAADFLRVCMLWLYGGIYADADDRLIGNPNQLLERAKGCLLFREHYGAIANNLMCSAPEHPVMGQAVEMAKTSLLRRENDSTWSKTGPGMITRAVASVMRQDPTALNASGLTIRKLHELHNYVSTHIQLPYKRSPDYWNWQGDKECPSNVLDFLNREVEA